MSIATAATKIQWYKMMSIRNCGKIINGDLCPCANRLRKITLKIPRTIYDVEPTKQQVLEQQIKYNKCFHKSS